MIRIYPITVIAVLILLAPTLSAMPPADFEMPTNANSRDWDNDTYINANRILMFVTNHGSFGNDVAVSLGRYAGTYFPVTTFDQLENGFNTKCVLYAAGLWVGGKVNGEVRVTVARYDDEYVPGPMVNGTFQPDNPSFKVYKLHADSLADNPNSDYLNWPVDQGAPVDSLGQPAIVGDQMLWTVFNDADPDRHWIPTGSTAPLGLEIQQTVWAFPPTDEDTITVAEKITVAQAGSNEVVVDAYVTEAENLTQDTYAVEVDFDWFLIPVWRLVNTTTGDTLIDNNSNFTDKRYHYTSDGFAVRVTGSYQLFESFQVVANGGGLLDPPVAGALDFAGFPTGEDANGTPLRPGDDQQLGDGQWAFHTADNGGTSGGGTRCCFDAFLARVTRNGGNNTTIAAYDYEMRFTGDNATPGVGGSYAIEAFNDDNVFWVPFELWNIGVGTPDDPSDDVRLIPLIIDDANSDFSGDNIYALESWGTAFNGGGEFEHSASGGDNDPFTDWVYWYTPANMSPGEAGYLQCEADFLGPKTYNFLADEVFARTVLINWNGGDAPPFNQDVPEQGTVFRIVTGFPEGESDTYTFTPGASVINLEPAGANVIYIKYKIYNKGDNVIEDAYISLWSDPEIGDAGDDLIGCDTLDNLFYCYNEGADADYGLAPPAVGFKIVDGPLVPSPGDMADFDGAPIPGYRNLPLTSFMNHVNPIGPDVAEQAYNSMRGLLKDGSPYMYWPNVLTYMHSGDPVTNTGDLDANASDRRMFASCGPINMMPGDSQYILITMAVGQGESSLESITVMKEILNTTGSCCRLRGDVNHQDPPQIDIADPVYLISYMFNGGPAPICDEEGDANGDGAAVLDIADLVYLIDYMFQGGPPPPPCR